MKGALASVTGAGEEQFVVPGDELGPVAQFTPGDGTYVRGGAVCAAVLGRKRLRPADATTESAGGKAGVLSVERLTETAELPGPGDVVLARVTRISALVASAEVLVLDDRPLAAPAAAVIRKEHVRESEIDKASRCCARRKRRQGGASGDRGQR
jgi:exosome complex RNA-binding protein Csl4